MIRFQEKVAIAMNILIVDDHAVVRKGFARLLEGAVMPKPVCIQSSSGEEALIELQKSIFDIVFLDVSMPVMDGYDACKIIRSEYPRTRVIMLTQLDKENLFFSFLQPRCSFYSYKRCRFG